MQLLFNNTLHKLMSVLSRTFIHSLWQGLLLGIIAALILQFTVKSGAVKRYNSIFFLIITFITGTVITFIWQWDNAASQTVYGFNSFTGTAVAVFFSGNTQYMGQLLQTISHYIIANEQLIFYGWLIVVTLKLIKLSGALWYNHRVRHRKIYEPGINLKQNCSNLGKKLGLNRTVGLLESGYCKIPLVLGYLKPVILLPAGLLTNLPADQVEAIVLHELAHIRRNDYLVNFFQNIVETIFFFNPFLLWLSSRLREERENCCDDIALLYTQNRKSLAAALISFKAYELYGNAFTTAFPGRKNFLFQRVSRILYNKNNGLGMGEKLFFIPAIIIFFTVMLLASVTQNGKPVKANANTNASEELAAKTTITVIEEKKSITDAQALLEKATEPFSEKNENKKEQKEAMDWYAEQAEAEKEKAALDKLEASQHPATIIGNKEQAANDQKQAKADQEQALADMIQAKKDQEQAIRDQNMAKLDDEQAMKNKILSVKDEVKANMELQKAMKEKESAEKAARNQINH
jgi:bla regulator protein BlaR1